MASIVELTPGTQPKRMVRKLTEQEILNKMLYGNHTTKYHLVLEDIRLRPFQKDPDFHTGKWDMIMTWLSGECDYKRSIYYGLCYEDFVFTIGKDNEDDYYIQTKDRTDIYNIHSEEELCMRCDEHLADVLLYTNANAIFYNLKDGLMNQTMVDDLKIKPDDAPSYESVNCPICFCDFVENENESDFLYNKATGKLAKDDERVVRVDTCCGHLLCIDCFNNVRNKGNRKCPTCRAELDMWCENSEDEWEDTEFTLDDIQELIYAENMDELLRITNIPSLRNDIITNDGWESLSCYEVVYEYEGFFICQC